MTPQIGSFGLGFGLAFVLEDMFSNTAAKIEQEMGKLEGMTDKLAERVDRSMNQMKLGFAAAGAGVAMLLPFGAGVRIAGEMEQIEIAFTTMLKSYDKAKTLVKDLRHFADITPFETGEIISAGRNLVAFGVQSDNVVSTLRMLGDVAAGVSMPIGELAEIFGKNLMQPNLQSRDIWQMTNRGIPIIQELAKVMGVANEEVMALVEGKAVKIEHMKAAFAAMSGDGGQFAGLMDKQSQSFNGLMSTMKSYVDYFLQALGDAVLPMLKDLVDVFGKMIRKIAEFMNTGIGKFIARLVFFLAVGLVVGGAFVGMLGLMRFSAIMLAGAFSGTTKALILQTIAQKGVIAGFRAMAAAAWASLGPYVAVLIPIALVLFTIVKAWKSFTAVMNGSKAPAEGLLGVFQKLGGIFQGIVAIFRSWDGKNFTLTEGMAQGLEKLGILDTVIAIGTWLIRIKSFFSGVFQGMKEGFRAVWSVIKPIWNSIEKGLEKIGINIGKNTTGLDKWVKAGKIVGYILVGIFVAIAAAAVIAAVTTAAAWLMPLIPLALVALALWGLWKLLKLVWDFFVWVGKGIWSFFKFIGNKILEFIDWILGIPARAYQMGVDFINSIVEGLKAAWQAVKGWFEENFSWLMPDSDITMTRRTELATDRGGVISRPMKHAAEVKASAVTPSNWGVPKGIQEGGGSTEIHNHIILDGKEISKSTSSHLKEKAARG